MYRNCIQSGFEMIFKQLTVYYKTKLKLYKLSKLTNDTYKLQGPVHHQLVRHYYALTSN